MLISSIILPSVIALIFAESSNYAQIEHGAYLSNIILYAGCTISIAIRCAPTIQNMFCCSMIMACAIFMSFGACLFRMKICADSIPSVSSCSIALVSFLLISFESLYNIRYSESNKHKSIFQLFSMDLGSCQKKVLIIIFINLARFVTAITAIYLYGAFLIVENTGNELVICLLIIRCLFSLLFVCFISYNDIITEEDSDSDFYSLSTVVVDDNIRRELGELRIRELSLEDLNLEDLQ